MMPAKIKQQGNCAICGRAMKRTVSAKDAGKPFRCPLCADPNNTARIREY